MNPKASATLEKARDDRRRSDFKKALSRLEEGVEKFAKELELYTEAIDVGMEAGESLKAIQIFKRSQRELPDDAFELWSFTIEKVGVYNDPIVGRFMLEQGIKGGDLPAAHSVLQNLTDHAAGELLERLRTKKQTMSVARGTRLAPSDEGFSYTLGEALVHLRLGRFPEATDGFVRALDEYPGTFNRLEPFLVDMQRQHPDKGEMSYALGCCYIAGGRPSKGLENLVYAAKKAPLLRPSVIEKIESLGDHPELSVDIRHLKLAELYLGQADLRRASDLLGATLERNGAMAGGIADALRSAVENVGENLDIHFIFVEASFTAGRRETALAQLRKIHRCPEHRASLVEWLESKSQSGTLSAEIQLFFAETALIEGLFGKAIEIFKEMLSHGTQEQAAIKELLSKHQSAPLVRHFYNERFGASLTHEKETNFDLERYDDPGFAPPETEPSSPNPYREQEMHRPDDARGARHARPESDETPFGATAPRSPSGVEIPRSDFDNRDFSLSMHAPAEPPLGERGFEEPHPSAVRSDDSDLFEYLNRNFSSGDRVPHEAGRPGEIGQDVLAVDPAPQTVDLHAQSAESHDEAVESHAQTIESHDEAADPPEDFDSLYRAFLDGTLDHGRILQVVEKAFDEVRMTEMKRLLAFEPANLGEDIARKYQLARYYLATDRPMSALVALKTVQLGALSREERKVFLLRIADCYRELHNHEAAHSVYLKAMSEHPGDSDIEAMAKTNYSRYIEAAAGAAPALEKLTDL